MSYKPYRGNRIFLDKNLQIEQDCYFQFWKITEIKERSKIAYKWYRACKYLNSLGNFYQCIEDFKKECLENTKEVYKPFLKLIQNV